MPSADRRIARWVVTLLALSWAVLAVLVAARDGDVTTFAGRSVGAGIAHAAAGAMLIVAGVLAWRWRPSRPWGPLAILLAATWFAADAIGWQTGPGAVRALALAAESLTGAAVAHLGIELLGSRRARRVLPAVWVTAIAVAVGRILAYDPLADPACAAFCARNPLLVAGDRGVARALDWAEAVAALAGVGAMAAAGVEHPRRGTGGVRRLAFAFLPLIVACAWAVRAAVLAVDPGDDPRRPVLLAEVIVRATAMAALAAGLVWATSRAQRAARALRRLTPADGSLEAALSRAARDPSLRVLFPLGDGGWIDAEGEPVAIEQRETGRALSLITRDGRPLAGVLHDPGGLDEAVLTREIGAATRLAIDNERLRAEARAQLRELSTSRARIVETGDAERRRLERDLHDGAQQRLVGLRILLSLVRETRDGPELESADGDLRIAIDELRELAHGIHPVELTDEGLAAALEALADRSSVPVRLAELPQLRAPLAAETAAYVLVDEVVRLACERSAAAPVTVAARRADDLLAVEVCDAGAPSADVLVAGLVDVADRVHALDGRLVTSAEPQAGGVRVRVELPCG